VSLFMGKIWWNDARIAQTNCYEQNVCLLQWSICGIWEESGYATIAPTNCYQCT
jgi:hypothetical protein